MLKVLIQSPHVNIFEGQVSSITIPGAMGSFQILPGHAAIIAKMAQGKIKVSTKGQEDLFFETAGGILDFKDDKALLLNT